MHCWDCYEDDHAGAVIATNLFTGTVFSCHENDLLIAAIYLKVTITSSVHNSIYWNEESCDKLTTYCWKVNGFATVTAGAESSSNDSCYITRHESYGLSEIYSNMSQAS